MALMLQRDSQLSTRLLGEAIPSVPSLLVLPVVAAMEFLPDLKSIAVRALSCS